MPFVFAFVGAILGLSLLDGFPGFLTGAALGALLGMVGDLKKQLHELRARMEDLEKSQAAPQAQQTATPLPVAKPYAPTAPDPQGVGDFYKRRETPVVPPPLPPQRPVEETAPPVLRPAPAPRPTMAERAPQPQAAYQREIEPVHTYVDEPAPGLNWETTIFPRLWSWLTQGNVPVKVGIVVLLFGVAAAIQYAASLGWLTLPMPVRLLLAAGIAVGGLVYGIRSAPVRPAFGVAVQGGALGVLLLVVFGAFARYGLISPMFAFACVIAIVGTAAGLALRFNAPVLAVLGLLGGFLAPVLISTGSNNPVALFAYIALLDAGVLALAWRRPWRALNVLAFAGTFILGLAWGSRYYTPQFFYQVEPFLIFFFLFFAAIPLLYARAVVASTKIEHHTDLTLLFGTPLVAFPLQIAMVGNDPMGLGLSALAVAVVYAFIAMLARTDERLKDFFQASIAIAVGFVALAAPLALSERWTSAAWAVQGLGLVFVGLRQDRTLARLAGIALIGLGALSGFGHLLHAGYFFHPDRFLFNAYTLDMAILVLAPFLAAWLHQEKAQPPRRVVNALLGLSLLWWTLGGLREINLNLTEALEMGAKPGFLPAAWAVFAALTAATCCVLVRRKPWPALAAIQATASMLLLPLGYAGLWGTRHWLTAPGWLFWPACFIALAALPSVKKGASRWVPHVHLFVLASLLAGISVSLWRVVGQAGLGDGWQILAAALAPCVLMLGLAKRSRWALWPIDYSPAERGSFIQATRLVLFGGWVIALFQPGNTAPLPFLPLLNPLDLMVLAGLFVAWRNRGQVRDASEQALHSLFAIATWAVLSLGVLRSVHHLASLPWSTSILASPVAQASLTVAWCVAGVVAWVVGSKRGSRALWQVGAILLGVVLAKLMLIDRTMLGNAEGIVAFLIVGALLVGVGRVAPSPPKEGEK